MVDNHSENSRRIAKNTLMLYFRMLFLLLVGLYTSRVVLQALGESDYGTYNLIGGVVSMFTIISGALSSAISRYITVELGKGSDGQMKRVFSSAVTIQLILAAVIVIFSEPIGLWFINNKMVIPPDRIDAARWVLHFSVLTFAINLVSVPYNAAIIAHERMSAFAYISIFEGLAKLSVALLIVGASSDKLILYAALMCVVAVGVRTAYGIYCRRFIPSCKFSLKWDRPLLKEMSAFAGWNTIGVSSAVCRDHGVNILLNLFFDTTVNAAKAVATQLNGVAHNFVTSFMTAVNPQITKSYVSGDRDYMFKLMSYGSRFSYYILLFICIPLILEAEYILEIWLKDVPEYTVPLVQWTLAFLMSESLSNPLITAMLATGNIRNYQLLVGGLQLMNLPVSYVLLKLGYGPVSVMVAAFVISQICLFARLIMLRRMIGLDIWNYMRGVYANVIDVTIVSAIIPFVAEVFLPDGFIGLMLFCLISVVSTALSVFFVGCSGDEREFLMSKIKGYGQGRK